MFRVLRLGKKPHNKHWDVDNAHRAKRLTFLLVINNRHSLLQKGSLRTYVEKSYNRIGPIAKDKASELPESVLLKMPEIMNWAVFQ